jgi:hypothetical protein
VAEIEAHALAVHHLALLGYMRPEYVAKGRVREVRGGVIEPGARPTFGIDAELNAIAHLQRPRFNLHGMGAEIPGLLEHVGHRG